MAAKSIDKFISAISANGGMAMSNGYDVEFDLSGLSDLKSTLEKHGISVPKPNDSGEPGSLINLFCDEAMLPNISAATGQLNNRYLGEGTINYPHTRMVSEFSLSWMCDANMAPYKFLTAWHNFIFGDWCDTQSSTSLKDFKSIPLNRNLNKTYRLRYPNEYQAVLRIAKTEKGKNAPNSRVPVLVIFQDVYPYSIDSVPLSYGSSQITKVTANFYYTRHYNHFADVRKYDG